jgi:hypothetical protein
VGAIRAAALGIALALGPAGARADEPSATDAASAPARVALEIVDCPEGLAVEVRRIVGIEIGDLLAPPAMPSASAPARVDRLTVRCHGTLAFIDAAETARDDHVDRSLELADFPADAAPRALALAAIEELAALSPAVRARLSERRLAAPPPVVPAKPSSDADRAPPRIADARWRLEVAALRRQFPQSSGLVAYGAGLHVERRLSRHALGGLDLDLAGGSRTVSLGDAKALQASAALVAGGRFGGPALSAAVTVGARLGLVRLSGDPSDAATVGAATVTRLWGGPLATVEASSGAGAAIVSLSLEGGFAVAGADGLADASVALAVRGPWIAACFAVGIQR